ncbi:kynurenine aminotransferase-like [Phymastichus coffea]|uniref:kynurenine aminotransferase-like n=1 Tax=Phymastichus coffea TaxID=108790 RepID=UPI00273C0369|nr:kynurenine aminotransferase-like [Phymastichus coffea]XP_058810252.1 kynurenine aminotransferase-like [Phymastichus coffea]
MSFHTPVTMISRHITTFFIACCLVISDAAVIKSRSKFDFPTNLIGLNDTAEEWLDPYSDVNDLADFGKDLFDGIAPRHVIDALINATASSDPFANQYTEPSGSPRLRTAIAKTFSPLIGQELNGEDNVLITVGATEALRVAVLGHTMPGDEWIVIEPTYIKYIPDIKMAWGVPRLSPLKLVKTNGTISGDDWLIDKEQLESLFNKNTKGIMLNNPLNPLGKVYQREELEFIGNLAKKYDTIVISDEAHEWMTFKPHIRMASLPGMFERTITIGSASKSFSVSGFRVGWAYGHPNLLNHLKVAHLPNVACAPSHSQYAVAYAFEEEQRNPMFFASHSQSVKEERDMMVKMLTEAGLDPVIPNAGFCMIGNWSSLRQRVPKLRTAMDFIIWMIENVGVLGWPLEMFYGKEHKHMAQDYVRFCFHKNISTLEKGAQKFKKMKTVITPTVNV